MRQANKNNSSTHNSNDMQN